MTTLMTDAMRFWLARELVGLLLFVGGLAVIMVVAYFLARRRP